MRRLNALRRAFKTPWVETLVVCALTFTLALVVYRSNDGFLYTYDSAPASLFVFNLLEHNTLTFDAFRGGYLYGFGAAYIFTEAPNGHLEPIFPIGTAILTAPIYALDYLAAGAHGPFPEITAIAFEGARLAYEKGAAAIVGAVAAVLFFLCARIIGGTRIAMVATIAFAFGSEMWTIGSQALWQHGSVNLVTLAMILALLREHRASSRRESFALLALAGICAGFLPVIRPTAIAFALAGIAYVVERYRLGAWPFAAGFVVGLVPGAAWNLIVFHSLVGGYAVTLPSFTSSLPQAGVALAGLFVSPSKGLLLYTPFVVFSVLGALRATRTRTPAARLLTYLAAAAALAIVNYAFFLPWDGGAAYGPRYLTDIVAVAALLLVYAVSQLDAPRSRRTVTAAIIALTIGYSVSVQAVGANGEPKSNWSGVPFDESVHTERVWQWTDTQIERDALTVYRLWEPNPTFAAGYAPAFDGRIIAIGSGNGVLDLHRPFLVRPGASLPFSALVENDGESRWFGYDTGFYYGQARVRVRFLDSAGTVVLERYLSIPGSPKKGQRARAIGALPFPSQPGNYAALFDIDCFQNARIGSRHVGAVSLPVFVIRPAS